MFVPLRLARPLDVPLAPVFWFSSAGSSASSFLARLLRPELLDEGAGRWGLSLGLGPVSEVGEPAGDLLVDVDGPERRPERRGSFGEGGGPIEAALAIAASVEEGNGTEEEDGGGETVRTDQRGISEESNWAR